MSPDSQIQGNNDVVVPSSAVLPKLGGGGGCRQGAEWPKLPAFSRPRTRKHVPTRHCVTASCNAKVELAMLPGDAPVLLDCP